MSNDLSHEFDSELVIGLVGAVGTELGIVSGLLRERLELSGYNVCEIRISQSVIPLVANVENEHRGHFHRISDLMTAGNNARERAGDDSVLALGVAALLFSDRSKSDDISEPRPKTAYIIRSLKRPEEVEQLRMMYPSGFILLGVHADETRRRSHLVDNLGMTQQHAQDLMDRDGDESSVVHGQRVNRTFHLADFFVRLTGSSDRLRCDIQRLVEIWFGHPFHTPLFDEFAMYMAFAAALRSADLSRQVGAVVTKNRQLLSTGANECPRAGGGLYWPIRDASKGSVADAEQGRDFTRNEDPNDREQSRIVDEIVEDGATRYGFDKEHLRDLLERSRIRDLTEFGRVVHAEMEALLACARNQLSTIDATVFCTTFPCHNCAKHIVAAGIKRVVYIEPYPKSKALELHGDSIRLSSETLAGDDPRVVFEPFEGVGPRRYFDLFSCRLGSSYDILRKDHSTGKTVQWSVENARLRIQMKACSYLDLEMQACELFEAHLKQIKDAKK